MKVTSVAGFSIGLACISCSASSPSEGAPPPAASVVAPPVAASTIAARSIATFEGHFDPVTKTLDVVTHGPAGVRGDETLTYGTSTGDVYFHTCSVAYDPPLFGGEVSGINLGAVTIQGLNAVIDSVSETGVTLASGSGSGNATGIIASYGAAAPNAQNCTAPLTWEFNVPSSASFSFAGHAEGTPSNDVVFILDGEGSVGATDFEDELTFAEDELAELSIGSSTASDHAAVIEFATSVNLYYSFAQTQSASMIKSVIKDLTYAGGNAYLDSAISMALTQFTTNGRAGANRVIVLFTSGKANPPAQSPCSLASQITADGVTIYAVLSGPSVSPAGISCIVPSDDTYPLTGSTFPL